MDKNNQTILVIDDDDIIRKTVYEYLTKHNFKVLLAENGRIGVEVFKREKPDLVLTNLRMPEVDGLDVIRIAKESSPETPLIVISGTGCITDSIEALKLGAFDYILKPFEDMEIIKYGIEQAFKHAKLQCENKIYQENLEALVHQKTTELQASETKYHDAIQNLTEGFYSTTLDGSFLMYNDEFIRINGLDPNKDYHGKKLLDFWQSPEDRDAYIQEFNKTGFIKNYIVTMKRHNNELFTLQINSRLIKDSAGNPVRIEGSFLDITEQQRTKHELQASEENLRTTLNSISDAVISTDITGNITAMNPVAENLTGWSFESANGMALVDIFNIVNNHTQKPVQNPVMQVLKHGEVVGLANHTVLMAKDGRKFQISDSATPIRDSTNKITGVVLVFRNITEEYEMQEAIRKSEQKFRGFVESLNDLIWEVDAQNTYTYLSPQTENILGYMPQELIGKTPLEHMPEAEAKKEKERFAALNHNQNINYENITIHKSGQQIILEISRVPFFTPEGKFAGYRGVTRDITARKQAEEALKISEERFRGLMDQAPFSIQIFDDKGKTVQVNKAWEKLWGVNSLSLLPDLNILEDEQLKELGVQEHVRRAYAGEKVASPVIQYNTIVGNSPWVKGWIYPIFDKTGTVKNVVIIHEDVTALMISNNKLKERQEQYRLLVENQTDLIVEVDNEGRFL